MGEGSAEDGMTKSTGTQLSGPGGLITDAEEMMRPIVTVGNWKKLGLRCHRWWMHKMGITLGTVEERVFLAVGLAGEVGELANLIKKEWRDGPDEGRQQEIKKEIADVQGYLSHLATSYDWDLDSITADKTEELVRRWPEAFEGPSIDSMGVED